VRIDLTRGEVGLRASMDVPGERGVGTDTFASNAGALVAIDGDWSDGYTPVGLAMGNGWLWHDHYDDPTIGATWGTFGCDVWNGCTIDSLGPLSTLFAYTPALAPLRFYNAVGTNGLLLLDDGVRLSGCYDGCPGDSCRNPRSAVCLEQGGELLWFIVVDGRRSGASGMTCSETRDLVEDLGCWDAAMLDGGGSSAIWVDGAIRNQPSDGSPRSVAGSIGITYADTPDAICPFTAGAWCDGSVMRTCNGSLLVNEGDCGAFGLACQEDGDWAYCVNWACPAGDGNGAACTGPTQIESCTDGVYSSGDCGFFGLACGSDGGGTSCMDPLCTEGPNSSYCVDADTVGSCSAGAYQGLDCGTGELCQGGNGNASCVAQGDDDDDAVGDDDDDAVGDDDDAGGDDDDSSGDDAVSDDDDFVVPRSGTPGLAAPSGCSGCQTSSAGPAAGWLLLFLGLRVRPRGRRQRPQETTP